MVGERNLVWSRILETNPIQMRSCCQIFLMEARVHYSADRK